MDLKITYKKIKYIHLRVKDNVIYVSAPFFTPKSFILDFIKNNGKFIENQVQKQEKIKAAKEIKNNDTMIFFDNPYTILSTCGKAKKTEHYLFLNDHEDYRKQIKKLFQITLYEVMYRITLSYFKKMSLQCSFPKIIIKDVKSKWGSYCKNKHEIVYSSELIFKEKEVYDYLVVHELAHILQFNHSPAFYRIVEQYCPNYKTLRKKLKEG